MLNLILVEDNPADRAIFQLLIKETGVEYNLKIFNNGADAISYFGSEAQDTENTPSGVVLDLNVPRKNGFEILEFIRTDKTLYNVPVAVLSSSQNADDRFKIEKENAYFFSKSFRLPEMKQTVDDILKLFQ